MRAAPLLLTGIVLILARGLASESQSARHDVVLNGQTFTLPAGFTIECVAGPPLVDRPMMADFDEQGRLYVADSSGTSEKVEAQLEKKPHRIVRLEDTDGDGRFDRSVVFADRMMFPEGTLWYRGSLYVAAPPSIWKLTDTDGDGRADRREEWYAGKTLTGCANDLHGPYLGPDGWIYWCKGAFARQTHERPGRKPLITRAAHIFRAKPDGTGVEAVMNGGMDNPVECVFTPGGERIFTTTFLVQPGGGERDGLIHALYGGMYGKDHDPIHEHPWTGPSLLPPLVHLGPAAPSGLCRYQSEQLGVSFRDNLFAALFNMRKVTRHELRPAGASFSAITTDFLVSDRLDFHPTDVLEDADGSLLVIDTGGWYKLCCPTSQLVKPDILGGIYRIRREGAKPPVDPRGLKLNWQGATARELASRLDDPRPAVRNRAIDQLAQLGADAIEELRSLVSTHPRAEVRLAAVWTACRIRDSRATPLLERALTDESAVVRQAALHALSVRRERACVDAIRSLLSDPEAGCRRAAAEALGRLDAVSAIPQIFQALGKLTNPPDFALEHSLIYALIEMGDCSKTREGLASPLARVRRAARIALDQMEGSPIRLADLAADLASPDPETRASVAWIVGHHPEWGADLAQHYRRFLTAGPITEADQKLLGPQLARLASHPGIQQLLAELSRDEGLPDERRLVIVRIMAQARLREIPASWWDSLTRLLETRSPDLLAAGLAAGRQWPAGKDVPARLKSRLLDLGDDAQQSATVRLAALAAMPGGIQSLSDAGLKLLSDSLEPELPVSQRGLAADVIARAQLTRPQLLALAAVGARCGPMEIDRVLQAVERTTEDAVGRRWIEALRANPVKTALPVGMIRLRFAKYGPGVQAEVDRLAGELDAESVRQRERVRGLLAELPTGDLRRGQVIFHGAKAACFSCHAIGYRGGTIGPDLTRIGTIRTEKDLLESIVLPSASFTQGYQPVSVEMRDGKTHNGLIARESAEEIVVVLGADQEVRLPRAEVLEVQPSKVSIMPAGLDQQLSAQDLADLIAFLKACR